MVDVRSESGVDLAPGAGTLMPLFLVSGQFRGSFSVQVDAETEEEAVEAVESGEFDTDIVECGMDIDVEEVETLDDENDDA